VSACASQAQVSLGCHLGQLAYVILYLITI
jgi:hypothetical protein